MGFGTLHHHLCRLAHIPKRRACYIAKHTTPLSTLFLPMRACIIQPSIVCCLAVRVHIYNASGFDLAPETIPVTEFGTRVLIHGIDCLRQADDKYRGRSASCTRRPLPWLTVAVPDKVRLQVLRLLAPCAVYAQCFG